MGYIPLPAPSVWRRLDTASDDTFARWVAATDRKRKRLTLQEFAEEGEWVCEPFLRLPPPPIGGTATVMPRAPDGAGSRE